MAKRICEKYWSYSEQVSLQVVETQHRFLWWTWTETFNPTEFKYCNKEALLDEVNRFIEENDIQEILVFKNNARYITVGSYEAEWDERRGGMQLVYLK